MSDSQKIIDRIQTLLQRTEAKGASEAEENTAARMVCKLLRQFPGILQPVPNLHDIEQQRHRAAAAAPQTWNHWRPSGGFNNNTASGTGEINDINDAIDMLRNRPSNYVSVRYTRLLKQNSTEVLLLVETHINHGYEEIWLPLDKLIMKTRVIWIEEATARKHKLFCR